MIDDESRLEWLASIDALEDGQKAVDGLIVCRVNTERPLVGRKKFDDWFEFFFHRRLEIGAWLKEVLEVGRRPCQVLASSVMTQERAPRSGLGDFYPALIIAEFRSGILREQIVGHAHCQLAVIMQFLNDVVVLRIVLSAAASINDRRYSKSVHLAHVMPRRVDLIFNRQLRTA